MLFFRLCSFAILMQFLLFATPALAQKRAPAQAASDSPALNLNKLGALLHEYRTLPPWVPRIEVPPPFPRHRQEDAALPEERRFSYWGYRHRELHERRVIAELLERTKGKNCCNGIQSGECRISKVDLKHKLAFIDGDWCPIDPDTRVTPLQSLAGMHDGDEEIAVVCAGKTAYGAKMCSGATTYCIGVKPPKV